MLERINKLKSEVNSFTTDNINDLENFRVRFLGKKGFLSLLFSDFSSVSADQKREYGKLINDLKNLTIEKVSYFKTILEQKSYSVSNTDLTLPGDSFSFGSRHPISIVRNNIVYIFTRIGFIISEGPEIEDDNHVFSKLNFPPEHPARDMQDTFFIEKEEFENSKNLDILLRTHTSSVQVRDMENSKPPIRTISPGRVFRNEAISARAHCIFHQVEGLYIDTNVSFADLKQTLFYFAKEMFGQDIKIRLRPSYFPFTEPSGEMDVSCLICGGKGCAVCKHTGWVEILGCGMVDPNVLENCNIDSKKYTGFAFGMGVERIAQLKYKVNDLRLYFENDVRFLSQFHSSI
ncbi:MAG: phenylalanine--tRNA ligase subunit alpha [Bacteroidetes bacterium]|nr:phenylalanine--tRNA ligase subunit alpha [Bacteroidota bacterium]